MPVFNKVILMGNLTRNPEVRNTPSGTIVTKFGLAVSRKQKDKEETMFIDIVAFGRLGEICGEYLAKGSPVMVEGRLSQNIWEQEGQKRSKHEIVAETMQMLASKKGGSNKDEQHDSDFSEDDDLIPF